MARSKGRTRRCSAAMISGRRAKADEFWRSACDLEDLAGDGTDRTDAIITLCAHAGIAAADVVCCLPLGEHAEGDSHTDAVGLLKKVDARLAADLKTLLDMKTVSGYRAQRSSSRERTRALRAADALITAATNSR